MSILPVRKGRLRKDAPEPLHTAVEAARSGCWLLRLTLGAGQLGAESAFAGTMRFDRVRETNEIVEARVTGDLYVDDGAEPPPAGVIPAFPRDRYRLFFALDDDGLRGMDDGRISAALRTVSLISTTWTPGPRLRLFFRLVSSGATPRFDVEVRRGSTPVGNGTATWIRPEFRSLSLHPAQSATAPAPLDNGLGLTWEQLFLDGGWIIRVQPTRTLAHPQGRTTWTLAELHERLGAVGPPADQLDREWSVNLLCVEDIDGFDRGIMFDFGSADSNGTPRQGSAVESGWQMPAEPRWGDASGKLFGEFAPLYFRAAVHEVGHALGMPHPEPLNPPQFMTPTLELPDRIPTFPSGLPGRLSDDEKTWLCHQPDPVVRPGGLPYPTTPADASSDWKVPKRRRALDLELAPLLSQTPWGAPVRLALRMNNHGKRNAEAPKRLAFGSGNLRAAVTDPAGRRRFATPVVVCSVTPRFDTIPPGKSIENDVTLFFGNDGTLFPTPGTYGVLLQASWSAPRSGTPRRLVAETTVSVVVPPGAGKSFEKLAARIVSCGCLYPTFTIGAKPTPHGRRVLDAALKDAHLRPHFESLEVRRRGQPHFGKGPRLSAIAALMSASSVMSDQEILRTAECVKKSLRDGSRAKRSASRIIRSLKAKLSASATARSRRRRIRSTLAEAERLLADI